ncbi:MAG TPA: hypothetical protein PK286_01430 [Devosia sp.]|nr:hypothetical protein [Devosia sp.]
MQELRTTTGQSVSITYDPARNQLTFHESEWFAVTLRSTGVPVKSLSVRAPQPASVVAPQFRRRISRAA